ncbi:MAG: hypothetical protein KatS3mg008_0785 [Acidimicrobiales bacterium]|nr:MAG: hypothetical protein KatS3mg008_0785 [Acidimicrobiales bacterium]
MPYLFPGKRAREVSRIARANGLRYAESEEVRAPVSLLAQGDGRPAENVVEGIVAGRRVVAFDYGYLRARLEPDENPSLVGYPADAPEFSYEDGNQYTVALTQLAVALPMLHLAPRNRRRPQVRYEDEIPLDDAVLRDMFQTWAADPDYADVFVAGSMRDFLLSTEAQFTFEVCGSWVACISRSLKAGEIPPFMRLLVEFCRRIPPGAVDFAADLEVPPPGGSSG